MKDHWCKLCGYRIRGNRKRCIRCHTPRTNWKAIFITFFTFLAFVAIAGWIRSEIQSFTTYPQKPVQLNKVKTLKNRPSAEDFKKVLPKVYVRSRIANLRQRPSLKSPILWKLKKGQGLTEMKRSGEWAQVVSDNAGNTHGWIHASLIGSVKPKTTKTPFQPEAFKSFQVSYTEFNSKIKKLKGMTFFKEVHYLGNGQVQITATGILLSAPNSYRKRYFKKMTQLWFDANKDSLKASAKIVDPAGRVQWKEKK